MFKIVLICTGNRFRSPFVEAVLKRALEGKDVEVSSMGILDLGEEVGALPEAIEIASGLGLDLASHKARGLEKEELARADLVIGFERIHVATAVVDGGASAERTFLLKELVRLLERDVSPPQAIASAHARRTTGVGFVPGEETADPLGQAPGVQSDVAEEIRAVTEQLVSSLFDGTT